MRDYSTGSRRQGREIVSYPGRGWAQFRAYAIDRNWGCDISTMIIWERANRLKCQADIGACSSLVNLEEFVDGTS